MVQNSDATPRTVGTRRSLQSFHHGLASDHYNALTPHNALTPRGTPVWCRLGLYLPSAIRAWCPLPTEGHPGAHGGRGWAVCGAERLLCQLTLLHQLHGHWRHVCRHMHTVGKRQIRGS
jgi:hypothetical protein